LLLLDPEVGRIIYSYRNPPVAPEHPPGLIEVWRAARAGRPGISDLEPIAGSGDRDTRRRFAQYLAAPIRSGGRIAGIVAVSIAPQAIESILLDRSGLGPTGATFLVGLDGKIRAPFAAGEEDLHDSPSAGLVLNWSHLAAQAREDERIGPGRSGRTTLSSYAPTRLPGLNWMLFAEIDESEIDRQIDSALNPKILPILGFSLALLIALALMISRLVALSIGRVIGELRRLLHDVQDGRLRSRAEVASMSVDFRPVLRGINELVEALERQMDARRRLEEHVRDSQRLETIGGLAAGIAHDFNNLLAQMRALAYIIERDQAERGTIDPARIEDMKTAIRRGMELVGQILTFSRPGQNPATVVDLRTIAEDTMKIIRAALPAGVTMALELGPDPLPVRGVPAQIHQIVMNLCVNAVQALRSTGGAITVRLAAMPAASWNGETDMALLSIEDSGPGIPEEIRERIFEPFFTTKPPGQGSGLGLAIVNGIVMAMGGVIRLESPPGRGSRFSVFLPLS
jgi:signal transduction histidine kinase